MYLGEILKRHLSSEDAAHCRLKSGRDEETADFAFDDEDDIQAARAADPISDVGKSGRAAASISGKSSWPETDGGLPAALLLQVFKEPVAQAISMAQNFQLTFGEQHAKALSRLLVFVASDAMADVDMPVRAQLIKTHALMHTKRPPQVVAHSAELRRGKLSQWVEAARAVIDARKKQPQRRSRASYDHSDEALYRTFGRLEESMQPDVLTEFFRIALSKGLGVNTVFNAAKGLQGILILLRSTVIQSQTYGGYTVLGEPDGYLKESSDILISMARKHGKQRRKVEHVSKAERETGYHLANICDARRMIFELIYEDLHDLLLKLDEKSNAIAQNPDSYSPCLLTSVTAGHLRGVVVVALQTSSPPLRVGAYAGLTQLATAQALLQRTKAALKNKRLAEEENREPTEEELNPQVILALNDKTSKEHGHAGIKINKKTAIVLELWLRYGRRHLGGEAAATSIPMEALSSRAKLARWCYEQQRSTDYNPANDLLLPTKSGAHCSGLGGMTIPVYNFYIQLDVNTTSMRRQVLSGKEGAEFLSSIMAAYVDTRLTPSLSITSGALLMLANGGP